MAYSMTAFSRVQSDVNEGVLCWEIRSVNHRYLDSSFRLPEAFRFMESSLRTLLREEIQRGKLECQLKFNETQSNSTLRVNYPLIDSLIQTAETITNDYQLPNDISVSKLLAWPGVVEISQPVLETISKQVEESFKEALNQLQEARLREGKSLKEYIKKRLTRLREILSEIRIQEPSISPQVKNKLLARLNDLSVEVDESRIEQEVAIILSRLDINEEVDRIELHAKEVERNLESKEAVGRRLDFLMQELNREANTLSSKSDSIFLVQSAVDMKVLIEQMREQIQNIE